MMRRAHAYGTLNTVPLTRWVHGTIEKMNRARATDRADWARFWLKTYRELGGRSDTSGSKGCPRVAAYGLWFLGRIVGSGRPLQRWAIPRVNEELGKNAAYAVLAADLLAQRGNLSAADLWSAVQDEYIRRTREQPATTEQGEIRVALILFSDGQLVQTGEGSA